MCGSKKNTTRPIGCVQDAPCPPDSIANYTYSLSTRLLSCVKLVIIIIINLNINNYIISMITYKVGLTSFAIISIIIKLLASYYNNNYYAIEQPQCHIYITFGIYRGGGGIIRESFMPMIP